MGMWNPGDAPTLVSNKYLLFGKISVTLQAAKGKGLITAVVLKSDSGDEIDWVYFPPLSTSLQLLTDTGTSRRIRQSSANKLLLRRPGPLQHLQRHLRAKYLVLCRVSKILPRMDRPVPQLLHQRHHPQDMVPRRDSTGEMAPDPYAGETGCVVRQQRQRPRRD